MPFKKGVIPQGAKPFLPGKTGNPNGRPKKLPSLDLLLADVLSRPVPGRKIYGEDVTQAEAILLTMIKEAKAGNVRAAELILDRAYGKARHSEEDVQPIIISVEVTKEETAQISQQLKDEYLRIA